MRITDINIGDNDITHGLKPINMSKLNQCVIIVGKNGSGKSRLLSLIPQALSMKPTKQQIHDLHVKIKFHENSIKMLKTNIKKFEQKKLSSPSKATDYDAEISQNMDDINRDSKLIEYYKEQISWSLINTNIDKDYYNYIILTFVPKKLDLKNSSNLGKDDLISLTAKATGIGIDHMSDSTNAYIQLLQDRRYNAVLQEIAASEEEKNKAINEYESLCDIINGFLGCKIERNLDGQATIFGFQLDKSNLSDGQKVILQYCIALHAQGTSLDDHILILDEPENHLHPSILFELIDKIKMFNSKGQIWIATHSIPLLSYFDHQDIWYMENGVVSKDGRVTENVLKSLLGNEEQVEKLREFISLPAIQAVNRYAFEALFPPKAVNTNSDDPQTMQIHSAITNYIQPRGKIKILDYGAGKGRMLNGFEGNKESFLNQIDYHAFDKYPENREDCISSISRLYENPGERYFQTESKLKSKHDDYSFDIIIMCNVLHEIDPREWLKIFGLDGFITKLLKVKGILLLVEDHQLPHGEKAYQNGFIVLDTPELKKLFCISSDDPNFNYDDFREDGRLKAHRIPQLYLKNLTSETRKIALEELAKNAKQEISDLRKSEIKNYKNGRLSGFWIHQLCNAELVLSEL